MTGITADGIEIDRDFDAAPPRVFAALVTPASFSRWFGGEAVQVPLDALDYRAEAGRSWSATMVLPDGNTIGWAGTFVEVDAPSRLVMTLTDRPAEGEGAVLTVELTPTGLTPDQPGTHLRMTQQTPGFSPEQQQATIAGWQSFFDVLGDVASE